MGRSLLTSPTMFNPFLNPLFCFGPGTLCLLSERKYSKRQAIKQIGNSCPGAILEHGHCLEYLLRTSCEAMTFFYEDMHF
ncbi:hypothetical protein LEMLEM_LOCUS12377 [Lemmus lemmus]